MCNYFLDIHEPLFYKGPMKLNLKKIKQEMKRQHLNQTSLAKRLGVTRQRVNYILKSGAVTFRVTDMIARVLNVDSKDLII